MTTMNKPFDLSKELENVTFQAILLENPELFKSQDIDKTNEEGVVKSIFTNVRSEQKKINKVVESKQFVVFQRAMKVLLACGQVIGLQPVIGILEKNITKIRFSILSWRFLHSSIIGAVQAFSTVLYLYRLLASDMTLRALAYFAFYLTTSSTTFIFQRIAVKWPRLLKEIYNSGLDEYDNAKIVFKVNCACITLISMSVLEHILALIARFVHVLDCSPKGINLHKEVITSSYLWLSDLGISYSIPIGIALQLLTATSSINWNYSDIYIVCMSLYLKSLLDCINKKIVSAVENNDLPSSFWRSLREDYNRATRLVRSFDEVISGVIFISFASNLFFICLQIYNTFNNGFVWRQKITREKCPNYPSGPFAGYEEQIYLVFSLSLLFGRSIAVSLIAASVNSASAVPATALYNVSPSMYCDEVQRFIDQVHSDRVALSGLKFFYITRELLLSVAGTVVTYELVLLQFSSQEPKNKQLTHF